MSPVTHNIVVEIVRYVDNAQPGWVAFEFVDAEGRRHTFVDKVPIVSSEMLDATSEYPRAGSAPCEMLNQWRDPDGREVVRISTDTCGMESTEGLSEFVVLSKQLLEGPLR